MGWIPVALGLYSENSRVVGALAVEELVHGLGPGTALGVEQPGERGVAELLRP